VRWHYTPIVTGERSYQLIRNPSRTWR
jgi:hypothetical protein